MAACRSGMLRNVFRMCNQPHGKLQFPSRLHPLSEIAVPGNFCQCCQQQRRHVQTFISSIARHITTQPQEPTSSSSSPFQLVQEELSTLTADIHKELNKTNSRLGTIAQYYFDGKGKALRPVVTLLMSQTCNIQSNLPNKVSWSQYQIAMIAEMLHNASLMHDDVLDASDIRRGKDSSHKLFGERQAVLAGDYILGVAAMVLARIRNEQVVSVVSQILDDLVRGEFMQLGSREEENARFSHYLKKTYKKTASLIANCCKAVAVLANSSQEVSEMAYQYGSNIGMAFQLADDMLDFTSEEDIMGKPTAADLKLGLATAPVLFAAQQYPELNAMIMRRFSHEGDVEKARYWVEKSSGVKETELLALQYQKEAIRQAQQLAESVYSRGLVQVAHLVVNRRK